MSEEQKKMREDGVKREVAKLSKSAGGLFVAGMVSVFGGEQSFGALLVGLAIGGFLSAKFVAQEALQY